MRRSHARTRLDSEPTGKIKMDPIKLHIRASNWSNFFSRSPKRSTRSIFPIIPLIAIAFVLVLCYLFVSVRNSHRLWKRKYGIIIDGGSTGTRMHVFEYKVEGRISVSDFSDGGGASMRVNPGLSAFSDEPEAAGESLAKLLELGKGKIPEDLWGVTGIRLMATAGLRLLEPAVQDRILDSCRRVLRTSGFKFQDEWASVITGSDEGVYAWVVANYALGTLGGDPLQTTGIIELGGASAQVTLVSNDPMPPKFSRAIKFGNTTYNLYSHSFLHFGLNVAQESLKRILNAGDSIVADPCRPKGYSDSEASTLSPDSSDQKTGFLSSLQSKGNFSECRSAALMMLQKGKEKCSYEHCPTGSTFIPKFHGKILATENFFYTSKFFRLGQKAFLSNLVMAGQQFCGEDWTKLKMRYHSFDDEDLLSYCFSSAYIVALLHDSFGIDLDEERIEVAKQVGNIPLDWAFGAFIIQSTAELDVENPSWIATIISDESPTLLSLVSIFMILMFTAWSAQVKKATAENNL